MAINNRPVFSNGDRKPQSGRQFMHRHILSNQYIIIVHHYSFFTVYSALFFIHHSSFFIVQLHRSSVFIVHRLPYACIYIYIDMCIIVHHHSSSIVPRSSFIAHRSSFIVHRSSSLIYTNTVWGHRYGILCTFPAALAIVYRRFGDRASSLNSATTAIGYRHAHAKLNK